MIHLITGKITNTPTVIMSKEHLPYHTPAKKDYSWWIKDADTGVILKQYIPPTKPKRPTVDTPRKGAWCQNNSINFKVGHIC